MTDRRIGGKIEECNCGELIVRVIHPFDTPPGTFVNLVDADVEHICPTEYTTFQLRIHHQPDATIREVMSYISDALNAAALSTYSPLSPEMGHHITLIPHVL